MNDPLYAIRPIAHIRSDLRERFGIPRQAGLAPDLTARIVFEEAFRKVEAVKGMESFSHLWLIWGFSETGIDMTEDPVRWSPLVTPPRLGGKVRAGVFATRSPYRPNSLGLSCVRLLRIDLSCEDAPVLMVGGADLLDGTPIYDIKPYVPYADCHPEASGGFAVSEKQSLQVIFPDTLLEKIPPEKPAAVLQILQQDPRGSYEKQPGYVYGLHFADCDIRFTVENGVLTVFDVLPYSSPGSVQKVK